MPQKCGEGRSPRPDASAREWKTSRSTMTSTWKAISRKRDRPSPATTRQDTGRSLAHLRGFERDVVPVLRLILVTREVHEASVGAHLVASRRTLSLVDCVSFEIMRRTGVLVAFAFDRHFQEFGYELTPPG